MVALTIGMPTYNDFDGVYFTIQALRLYQSLKDTELLVVDNFGCEHTRRFVEGVPGARYVLATDAVGTAAAKNRVFSEAKGEAVLCIDSHVLLPPYAVKRLRKYYRKHPDSRDLLQGPLVYDDLKNISTHFDPVWRGQMWGIWATNPRGLDLEGKAFEIPMQGMGLFSCRRNAWPGFNPAFRGFGWEEGYIHEKFRRAGGRTLCLPWLRWVHRFGRPAGVPYPLYVEDKLRNYLIGFIELGWDPAPALEHFAANLSPEKIARVQAEAQAIGISGPAAPQESNDDHRVRLVFPASAEGATPPLVSCICSTYNRAPSYQHLVEEAIESFLRQTYPHKELIVMNDCPGQELVCDAPGVRVINVPQRFSTYGDKLNAAIALSQGELIAPWDDDDISLPWRLTLAVQRLGNADYFNPKRFWFWDSTGLRPEPTINVGHNLSLYRRTAFEAVQRYPAIGSGVDAALDRKFQEHVKCVGKPDGGPKDLRTDELYYIYRWGLSPTHLSAAASDEERAANYQRIGTLPVEKGRFVLRPHWRTDYETATRQLIAG